MPVSDGLSIRISPMERDTSPDTLLRAMASAARGGGGGGGGRRSRGGLQPEWDFYLDPNTGEYIPIAGNTKDSVQRNIENRNRYLAHAAIFGDAARGIEGDKEIQASLADFNNMSVERQADVLRDIRQNKIPALAEQTGLSPQDLIAQLSETEQLHAASQQAIQQQGVGGTFYDSARIGFRGFLDGVRDIFSDSDEQQMRAQERADYIANITNQNAVLRNRALRMQEGADFFDRAGSGFWDELAASGGEFVGANAPMFIGAGVGGAGARFIAGRALGSAATAATDAAAVANRLRTLNRATTLGSAVGGALTGAPAQLNATIDQIANNPDLTDAQKQQAMDEAFGPAVGFGAVTGALTMPMGAPVSRYLAARRAMAGRGGSNVAQAVRAQRAAAGEIPAGAANRHYWNDVIANARARDIAAENAALSTLRGRYFRSLPDTAIENAALGAATQLGSNIIAGEATGTPYSPLENVGAAALTGLAVAPIMTPMNMRQQRALPSIVTTPDGRQMVTYARAADGTVTTSADIPDNLRGAQAMVRNAPLAGDTLTPEWRDFSAEAQERGAAASAESWRAAQNVVRDQAAARAAATRRSPEEILRRAQEMINASRDPALRYQDQIDANRAAFRQVQSTPGTPEWMAAQAAAGGVPAGEFGFNDTFGQYGYSPMDLRGQARRAQTPASFPQRTTRRQGRENLPSGGAGTPAYDSAPSYRTQRAQRSLEAEHARRQQRYANVRPSAGEFQLDDGSMMNQAGVRVPTEQGEFDFNDNLAQYGYSPEDLRLLRNSQRRQQRAAQGFPNREAAVSPREGLASARGDEAPVGAGPYRSRREAAEFANPDTFNERVSEANRPHLTSQRSGMDRGALPESKELWNRVMKTLRSRRSPEDKWTETQEQVEPYLLRRDVRTGQVIGEVDRAIITTLSADNVNSYFSRSQRQVLGELHYTLEEDLRSRQAPERTTARVQDIPAQPGEFQLDDGSMMSRVDSVPRTEAEIREVPVEEGEFRLDDGSMMNRVNSLPVTEARVREVPLEEGEFRLDDGSMMRQADSVPRTEAQIQDIPATEGEFQFDDGSMMAQAGVRARARSLASEVAAPNGQQRQIVLKSKTTGLPEMSAQVEQAFKDIYTYPNRRKLTNDQLRADVRNLVETNIAARLSPEEQAQLLDALRSREQATPGSYRKYYSANQRAAIRAAVETLEARQEAQGNGAHGNTESGGSQTPASVGRPDAAGTGRPADADISGDSGEQSGAARPDETAPASDADGAAGRGEAAPARGDAGTPPPSAGETPETTSTAEGETPAAAEHDGKRRAGATTPVDAAGSESAGSAGAAGSARTRRRRNEPDAGGNAEPRTSTRTRRRNVEPKRVVPPARPVSVAEGEGAAGDTSNQVVLQKLADTANDSELLQQAQDVIDQSNRMLERVSVPHPEIDTTRPPRVRRRVRVDTPLVEETTATPATPAKELETTAESANTGAKRASEKVNKTRVKQEAVRRVVAQNGEYKGTEQGAFKTDDVRTNDPNELTTARAVDEAAAEKIAAETKKIVKEPKKKTTTRRRKTAETAEQTPVKRPEDVIYDQLLEMDDAEFNDFAERANNLPEGATKIAVMDAISRRSAELQALRQNKAAVVALEANNIEVPEVPETPQPSRAPNELIFKRTDRDTPLNTYDLQRKLDELFDDNLDANNQSILYSLVSQITKTKNPTTGFAQARTYVGIKSLLMRESLNDAGLVMYGRFTSEEANSLRIIHNHNIPSLSVSKAILQKARPYQDTIYRDKEDVSIVAAHLWDDDHKLFEEVEAANKRGVCD